MSLINATSLQLITVDRELYSGLCYEDCTSWTGCDCPQVYHI